MKIYVDSDVVISSLLSQKGASHFLLRQKTPRETDFFVSNYSQKELYRVIGRMDIPKKELSRALRKLKKVAIEGSLKEVKKKYKEYTVDENDAHIIAGAAKSESEFLITYNLKDYKREKIKRDFGIKTMTPGQLLQYLRSIN